MIAAQLGRRSWSTRCVRVLPSRRRVGGGGIFPLTGDVVGLEIMYYHHKAQRFGKLNEANGPMTYICSMWAS